MFWHYDICWVVIDIFSNSAVNYRCSTLDNDHDADADDDCDEENSSDYVGFIVDIWKFNFYW